jgi:hypothetical protein
MASIVQDLKIHPLLFLFLLLLLLLLLLLPNKMSLLNGWHSCFACGSPGFETGQRYLPLSDSLALINLDHINA